MKFITTAQKAYSDDEIDNILIEIVSDLGSDDAQLSGEQMAVKYADFEIPEALLSNTKGDFITLQHMLAILPLNKSVKEMFEFIIEHGADVNVKDSEGNTPLHYIFRESAELTDTAKYLLDHNADVNAKNTKGKSPLYYVLKQYSGMDTAMELVDNYGAQVTPLIFQDHGYKKGFKALRNMQHQSTFINKITALEDDIKELKSETSALRSDMAQVLELLKGMRLKYDNTDDNVKNVANSVRMFGK